MKSNEDRLRDFWDNIKGVIFTLYPRRGRGENAPEKISKEIIAENFPNLGKQTVTKVQEVKKAPYRITSQRNIQHIVIKVTKTEDKQKILVRIKHTQELP